MRRNTDIEIKKQYCEELSTEMKDEILPFDYMTDVEKMI
jgi:hypothetical protein